MHIIRSTMGDFVLEHPNVPAGIASLIIGREVPGDHKSASCRSNRGIWYFQAQRIPEKTQAMQLWSEALLLDAGGLYPN
jgi:hypothetical protein